MTRKIKQKIAFIAKVLSTGADIPSKLTLLREFIRLTYGRYRAIPEREFSCTLQAGDRTARVYFSGNMNEIHTLVDIFVDDNYEPKHNHRETLFSNNLHTILDLGANIGLASMWFALTCPNASIDAYEPNPAMCALLRKNLAPFKNVRVFQKAIAGKEGTLHFSQSEHTLESSAFGSRDSVSIEVEAVTLDHAIEKIGGSVDLIKIDIEGSEFEAIGASSKFSHTRAVIGEAHTVQAGHTEEELKELLAPFNLVEIYNPNHSAVFGFYAAKTL